MNTTELLHSLLKQRVLILDGAMGTMIQRYAPDESAFRGKRFADSPLALKGCNDLLCLTSPEIIDEIHTAYLKAGADIIETNSFNANAISLSDYGMQAHVAEINAAAARIARRAADRYTALTPTKPRFVAGSVGPTNKTCSMSPRVEGPSYRDVTFDDLADTYGEQMQALIENGVDMLLIETIFDSLNAKAALYAAMQVMERCGRTVPIMLSVTLTESGRLLSGQTLDAFLVTISHAPVFSIGLNCSFGAREMLPHLRRLSENAPYYISAYPNAGLPNRMGGYDETPEETVAAMQLFFQERLVNIAGGCCGTSPEHIALLHEAASVAKPHIPVQPSEHLQLAGLEAFEITSESNFVNIGERCNVAGSRKFLRLIHEKNYAEAIEIARHQVESGAQIIDINMDDAMLDARTEMQVFLRLIASEPDICRIPVMIDSSKWEVISAGLKAIQGKAIVNSISLKEGEEAFFERAKEIKRLGAAVVVMAFDEEGQADTYERRIAVCQRAYRLLTQQAGIHPSDIIFDPNVLAIATGIESHRNYAVDFIESARWIRKKLYGAHVSGGISNLSFAMRGNNYIREAMHAVMLYHAIAAGMDMGIVNPSATVTYNDLPPHILSAVEDVVLNRRPDATERLIEIAEEVKARQAKEAQPEVHPTEDIAPEQRLTDALIRGRNDGIEQTLQTLLDSGWSALSIIDGALMEGMNRVGELFGEGKMFLPQVVKSARTMKQAVAFLQPYIEQEKSGNAKASNGKFILATVKGDVHDIGKNIVSVILSCNNFEVIDLGVMVPAETIVRKAIEEKADFIGLSGLITPSLEEMCRVATEMERAKLQIPLFIGGATTSAIHTATRIAPCYSAPVIYTRDAAQNPIAATQLLHPETRKKFIAELSSQQQQLRESLSRLQLLSLSQAQACRFTPDWRHYTPAKPPKTGAHSYHAIKISDLRPYINWRSFMAVWQLDASFADVAELSGCDHCKAQWLASFPQEKRGKAAEAMQLHKDASRMLDLLERELNDSIAIRYGIYPATSSKDSIFIDNGNQAVVEIPCLRQQEKKTGSNAAYYALSDFIMPQEYGGTDYIGVFAVTAGQKTDRLIARYKESGDNYHALLLQSLADRLAEAAAELFHYHIRTSIWKYSTEKKPNRLSDLIRHQGIRPAIGYPSLPDQSLLFEIDKLLDMGKAGIAITENGAMQPSASIAGIFIAHPQARYFSINRIDETQRADYCRKRGFSPEEAEKWLSV